MTKIHPTAVIEDGVKLADDVEIGPYCVIGKGVELKSGVKLIAHCFISGDTVVGENTQVYPFAFLGYKCQDLKCMDNPGKLIIGKNNIIREHATMHPGTPLAGNVTIVGDNNLFMVGTHVAHDCIVGSHIIMSNNATLAGHIKVDDYAIIGGFSAVHQFTRIGSYVMIGGMSGVARDVVPYALLEQGKMMGINLVGMKRRGFSLEDIKATDAAIKDIFAEETGKTLSERVAIASEKYAGCKCVQEIVDFMKVSSKRGFTQLCHKA